MTKENSEGVTFERMAVEASTNKLCISLPIENFTGSLKSTWGLYLSCTVSV